MVEHDGFRIFHAGDLNWWHWREASTIHEINQAEEDFMQACSKIDKEPIDVCFFPLDPRQGMYYDVGINYFILNFKPHIVIPMHWGRRVDVATDFRIKGQTKYTSPLIFTQPRQMGQISYSEDKDGQKITNVKMDLQLEDSNPPQKNTQQESQPTKATNDPFQDSDLPVDIEG